ncbi:MAG: site-specific recombinase [Cystobacterineae bacterium]|nr:site-specific recombinase [Cystobacterineae bacterium]
MRQGYKLIQPGRFIWRSLNEVFVKKKALQKDTEAWAHFKMLFGQGFLMNSALRQLFRLLLRLESPWFEQEGFIWLEDLAHWMWQSGRVPKSVLTDNRSLARARLLHAALKAKPALHEKLQSFAAYVVKSMDVAHMLTDTGLPGHHAFGSEILDRFMLNVLPTPPAGQEFSSLLMRLFPSERAVGRFEGLGVEGQTLLNHAFFGEEKALAQHWKDQMRRACRVLAMRISASGLANDVDERVDKTRSGDKSPFLKLPSLIFSYVEEPAEPSEKAEPSKSGKHPKMEDKEAQKTACRENIASCRRVVREVMDSLNHTGISVDLVYRLDLLSRRLDRLYALVSLCASTPPEGMGLKLVGTLVRGCEKDRSLGELIRRNSRLLARRVIESAGQSGEHYITQTRTEQFQMLASAAGGGVLAAIAVVIKASLHLIHVLAETPLFKGLASGFNYAGVFVTMQLLGFTLATKQPSMTAATLAGALKEYTSSSEAEKRSLTSLAELVVRTIRTQLFALLGNVGLVIPAALLINMGLQSWAGHALLTAEEAKESLLSFHFYESRSLAFAALTGGYLWLSSILAGTMENWVVFRKLPEAIASNRRFKKLLGEKRTRYLGQFILKNASGLAGNISLGFMLGLTPAIGLFFGMDLDIRHITFAAGQLTFAVTSMGVDVLRTPEFLWALGGLAGIAALNFGVSFSLALVVALRARDVGFSGDRRLVKKVFKHFLERPLDFVFAPKMELAPAASEAAESPGNSEEAPPGANGGGPSG